MFISIKNRPNGLFLFELLYAIEMIHLKLDKKGNIKKGGKNIIGANKDVYKYKGDYEEVYINEIKYLENNK